MKIVIAPDAFKGSLTAEEACEVMTRAVVSVFPSAQIIRLPIADGGEGTLDVLLAAGGSSKTVIARGPLGSPVQAKLGILDDETAVVELAQASGLLLLAPGEADPLKTSTYGTGQLIRSALDLGFRKLLVAVGGSATNDAGTGLLEALGVRFFNHSGERLQMNGGALLDIAKIDTSQLDERLQQTEIRIASDVDNPFVGKQGASFVFGPQKGADQQTARLLDAGLHHFAELTHHLTGVRLHDMKGAGAAGGSAGALVAYCNAEIASGIDTVLDAVYFTEAVEDADLILTGEGKTDRQTLSGKALAGVAAFADRYSVPVYVVSGSIDRSAQEELLGIFAGLAELDDGRPLEELMERAAELLEAKTKELLVKLKENKGDV